MNSLGAGLVWCGVQVSLLAISGVVVYLLLGRRGPAARSTAALSVLVIAIGLAALALSPWPRWWSPQPIAASEHQLVAQTNEAAAAQMADAASGDRAQPATGTSSPATMPAMHVESNATTWAKAVWSSVWDGLGNRPSSGSKATPRWPGVIAWLLAIGTLVGVVRLIVGLAAVRAYRRRTMPVTDEPLNALLEATRLRLGCLAPVELRESVEIGSPATVGWRRPLVLLPPQWREWSGSERQAVLAHEVAHIVRGDFAGWLVAQLSVVLHFYNPLVHWLARRLRIEQELAADALGAAAAGGSQSYLKTLALMALRQDDRAVSWAARPFLPARGTLLRRIEMLRDRKLSQLPQFSRTRRIVLCTALAAIGIAVAGLRGPSATAAATDDDSTSGKALAAVGNRQPVDLDLVPADAALVIAVRPSALVNSEAGKLVAKADTAEWKKMEDSLGVPLSEIEYAKFVMSDFSPVGPGPSFGRIVLRATQAHDWTKFAATIVHDPVAVESTEAGRPTRKFFKQGPAKEGELHSYGSQKPLIEAYYVADDRTIVFGTEKDMPHIMDAPVKPDVKWADNWNRTATGDITVMLDVEKLRKVIEPDLKHGAGRPEGAIIAMMAPLWQDTDRLFVGTDLTNKLGLLAIAQCASDEGAVRVQQTARGLATLGLNALAAAKNVQPDGPPELVKIKSTLVDAAEQLLKTAQVKHEGSTVTIEAQGDGATLLAVAGIALPAIQKSRAAASRAQSMNNMKQLAIAMHNYAAAHDGRLPPAVIMGPDGKTPHSWRVELLPYLEQQNLFNMYKMDEPWDSPANKNVSDAVLAIYTAPAGEDGPKNSTSYFVLTGKGTMFSGKEGMKFEEITGGASNTLMIVEAKRNIPWAKPEDIDYDPSKPLPKLGGVFPGGFDAAFADGSVRFLSDNVNEKVLRGMISPKAEDKGNINPNAPATVHPPATATKPPHS